MDARSARTHPSEHDQIDGLLHANAFLLAVLAASLLLVVFLMDVGDRYCEWATHGGQGVSQGAADFCVARHDPRGTYISRYFDTGGMLTVTAAAPILTGSLGLLALMVARLQVPVVTRVLRWFTAASTIVVLAVIVATLASLPGIG